MSEGGRWVGRWRGGACGDGMVGGGVVRVAMGDGMVGGGACGDGRWDGRWRGGACDDGRWDGRWRGGACGDGMVGGGVVRVAMGGGGYVLHLHDRYRPR
jgi:hypothetical protein